jgi:hypothetical protein
LGAARPLPCRPGREAGQTGAAQKGSRRFRAPSQRLADKAPQSPNQLRNKLENRQAPPPSQTPPHHPCKKDYESALRLAAGAGQRDAVYCAMARASFAAGQYRAGGCWGFGGGRTREQERLGREGEGG